MKKVLEEASTAYKLIKVDLCKKDVCLPTELADLGTATKPKLKAVETEVKSGWRIQSSKNQTWEGLFKYVESRCRKDARNMSA